MMTNDDYNTLLEKLIEEVEKLSKDLRTLRGQRVIRVVNVGEDTWTPPVDERLHTCGDSCQEATKDQVGICEVSEKEIRAAHRRAISNLAHLRRFFPLHDED